MPLLKKAIKLVPRQGDFYYLLGVCQSEAEVSRNEAEINLKKAIESSRGALTRSTPWASSIAARAR